MLVFRNILLVECVCGHGGKAWHEGNIHHCTYQNCKCHKLRPRSAVITKDGKCLGEQDVKTISGDDFIKYYNENSKELIWK